MLKHTLIGMQVEDPDEVAQAYVDEVARQAMVEQYEAQAMHQAVDQPKDIARVILTFSADSSVVIGVDWLDESQNTAKLLGQFTYLIHNGDFKKHMLNTYGDYMAEHKESETFISTVISTWADLCRKDNNQPAVRPSTVLDGGAINLSPVDGERND